MTAGYRAVKLKTGAGSPEDEAKRVRTVREALKSTGCRPEWIELELTESLLLDERGEIIKCDSADHCAAHDLVGCRDAAWDVAGAIAELYESMGGEVLWAGKPHPPIYIGGDSDATVKRVIRHEAGWISNPLPVEHLAKRVGQLRDGAGHDVIIFDSFDSSCTTAVERIKAIVGCGVMTGVGAAVRKAKVAAGTTVVVIGCGALDDRPASIRSR